MSLEWPDIEILDAKEVAIDYYKQTHNEDRPGLTFTPTTIKSCEGDLILAVNALEDYADLVDRYRAAHPKMEPFQAANMEFYAGRYRTIAAKLAAAMGYDRAATMERCRKRAERESSRHDDVGEEALILTVTRQTKPPKKGDT